MSLSVHKKKGKAAQEEDLFENEAAEDDDLFGGVASSNSGPSETARPTVMTKVTSSTGRAVIDPKRSARFEQEHQAVLYRCAPDRDCARPHARQNAVRNVLAWTDTPEQLEAAAELIPAMRRAGVTVAEETSRDLIGRCITLRRPDIALKILTQRNKYGVDLDLKSARDILHSIFVRAVKPSPTDASLDADAKPLTASHHEDALLLAALYPHFKLIRASQDPISSAILLSMFTLLRNTAKASNGGDEQLKVYREYGQIVATDLGNMIKRKQVHVVNEHDDSHRQRVWLFSEVRRPAVREALASAGIRSGDLKTIGALASRAT
ncbi:hypothetical protein FRB97_008413 [Tulasnella sp. 331]|nr:hypothetical protein FRB97_008413 [Tulasnella sp. 331]